MRKLYTKIDDWIWLSLQESYLWLLDRTGIYLATLEFALLTVSTVLSLVNLSGGTGKIVLLGLLCFNGLILSSRYLMQDKAETTRFNLSALYLKQGTLRHIISGMMFGFVLIDLATLDVLATLNNTLGVIYIYTFALMIRDRDKKPFFEKQEKLAMEGSSS